MADSRDPDGEQSPYLRVPWPLAALGVVIVLGVALGLGLWVAHLGRGPQQAQGIAVATTAVLVPTVGPVVFQTAPAQSATATVAPTTPTIVETPNAPNVSPTLAVPHPTIDPILAEQLDTAYQHYWDVRARALFNVDSSNLPEVAADDHLSALQEKIAELRSNNQAIETYIDHNFAIAEADAENAKVVDVYTDKSFYVDGLTHAEISAPANEELRERYDFRRIDDAWRVVRLVRSSS